MLQFFWEAAALLLLSTLVYVLTIRLSKCYYIRKISKEEYTRALGSKVIHYTDYISDEDYTEYLQCGKVKLRGTTRATSNYVMPYKGKQEPYVWFHPGDANYNNEPTIGSFMFTHALDNPRKYKIVINFNELDKGKMYIRPDNKNIIIKGNVYCRAVLETAFTWFDNKIHLKALLALGFKRCFLEVYQTTHKIIGKSLEKLSS